MKRNSVILTFCVLGTQGLFAAQVSTSEKELETHHYKAKQTHQLQKIHNRPGGDAYFKQNSMAMQRLIQAGADPNIIRKFDSEPLLCGAVMLNDLELTKCCLKHGANPNPQDDFLDQPPLYWATSVPVARLLLAYKADLHQLNDSQNLLHNAAIHGRSSALIAFFCNAGVDVNRKDKMGFSPLHKLFSNSTNLQKVAILLWTEADTSIRNDRQQRPLDILQQRSPDLVPQVQAIAAIIPIIKAQKKATQEKPYKNILIKFVPPNLADLVIDYIEPSWDDSCWPEINARITQKSSWTSCVLQ